MSFTSPHAERRLEAPIRGLAKKSYSWRGIPSTTLAEQYAHRHRMEREAAAAKAAPNALQASGESEMEGWFGRLRRLVGMF